MGAKGGPKTGGRQRGVQNKSTTDLHAICERMGINPFEKLMEYLVHPCDIDIRLSALKEICQYLYPKRKALEHSGSIDTNPYADWTLEEMRAEAAKRSKEAKKK